MACCGELRAPCSTALLAPRVHASRDAVESAVRRLDKEAGALVWPRWKTARPCRAYDEGAAPGVGTAPQGWRRGSVGVVAVEAGVPDGDLDLRPDEAVGAVLAAGRLLGEDRVGLGQQVQLSLGVRVVPDGEAVARTGRQVPGGHVDRPDRQAPDRVARRGDLHDPHRVPVGRDSRGELVTDGQGVVPFALVDRPDDTWYRLHLDTDDDLYEVDMVRAGHRATAASMKGAAAKRRRILDLQASAIAGPPQ